MPQSLTEIFFSLLFPPVCAACHKPLCRFAKEDSLLCSKCLSELAVIKPPVCSLCGLPFQSRAGSNHPCGACIRERPAFDSARAFFLYEGTARALIHKIKFRQDSYALRAMAMFSQKALETTEHGEDFTVIPVPLHRTRLRERGFNQALELSKRIFPKASINPDLLQRVRHTRPQMELSAKRRRENTRGAFRVKKSREAEVKDKNFLIFDDILTTGATVSEAARTLKDKGAGSVKVLAVSRAV